MIGKGLIGRIFSKKQIIVPSAEEVDLLNYMSIKRVYKLVDFILYEKFRSEQTGNWTLFSNGLMFNNGLMEINAMNPQHLISVEDSVLCNFGKLVCGFENKTFVGGHFIPTYQSLTLPRDYYRVMSLDLYMIEALQCILNNALNQYSPNTSLLEIPEFSLKDCKISGM